MSRTTVDLDPIIIRKLKYIGASSGESMSRVVNRLLRRALQESSHRHANQDDFVWRTAGGSRPAEGFDPASRDDLDLIEQDQ